MKHSFASQPLARLAPRCSALAARPGWPLPALAAGTLDKVTRQPASSRIGYRADARPFSYHRRGGKPAGFSVALCQKVADAVKAELKLPGAGGGLRAGHGRRTASTRCSRARSTCCAAPTRRRWSAAPSSTSRSRSSQPAPARWCAPMPPARLRDALAGPSRTRRSRSGAARPGMLTEKRGVRGGRRHDDREVAARRAEGAAHRRHGGAGAPTTRPACRWCSTAAPTALFGDRPVLLDAAQRGPAPAS